MYINLCNSYLSKDNFKQRQLESKDRIKIAHLNSDYWIRSVVEYLENSQEFQNLHKDSKLQAHNLKNFFRRSRIYLESFESNFNDVDCYFDRMCCAHDQRPVKVIKLRLIEGVDFDKHNMDFSTFRIQKFSKKQLDELAQNQINRIFYPNAELA